MQQLHQLYHPRPPHAFVRLTPPSQNRMQELCRHYVTDNSGWHTSIANMASSSFPATGVMASLQRVKGFSIMECKYPTVLVRAGSSVRLAVASSWTMSCARCLRSL